MSYFTRIRPYRGVWRVDVYVRFGDLTRLVAVGLGSRCWATRSAKSALLLVSAAREEQLRLADPHPDEFYTESVDDLGSDGAGFNSEHRVRVARRLSSEKPSGTYAKRFG